MICFNTIKLDSYLWLRLIGQIAVAQLMEAQSSFLGSQLHDTEYVLANLETAWVYVLQITEAIHEEGRDGAHAFH